MGTPTVTMRCPACGTELRAALAPAPSTQWFPCPSCHAPVPFVVPRELPPLYSWEVVPGLYPARRVPGRPRWPWRSVASMALAAAAILAGTAAGLLGDAGYVAAQPATYVVSGVVYEDHPYAPPTPAGGAHVVLYTDDNRTALTATTKANGTFRFAGVPNGGIEINVTDPPSYGPTDVYTFASRSYSTGTVGLNITLHPGGRSNATSEVLSPFRDLESFLTYVGGGAILLGVATAAAGFAAWVIRRPGGSVSGVLGSGAAVAIPVIVLLFSLDEAFPVVAAIGALAGGLGAFSLVLAAADLSTGGSRANAA